MSMNAELAAFYGTNGHTGEDLEKQAAAEQFAKLAAQHGIDLSSMNDEEVNALFAEVYPELAKQAMEGGFPPKKEEEKGDEKKEEKEEKDEEEKKESAAQHFNEKRAFQEKVAEADFMGRVMAHSFTQELGEIQKEAQGKDEEKPEGEGDGEETKEAQGLKNLGAHALSKGKKALKAGGKALETVGKKTVKTVGRTGGAEAAMKPGTAKAIGAGALGAGAGGAALAAKKMKKESSAADFEELAANHAIKVAEANGYDVEQATQLVSARFVLGLEETEKVAQVQDVDSAIHVRGLEYLESVGYPIKWEEVFPSE